MSKIAALARLALSHEEALSLTAELDRVLQHVALLREVDTSLIGEVSACAVRDDRRAPLAEDRCSPSLSTAEVLAQAPAQAEGQFAVARFVEG